MKQILIFLILLTATVAVTAQSTSGLYEETAPDLVYSGTGWVNVVDGDYSVMESSDIGDSVSIEFVGSSVIIYRDLLLLGTGTAEVCIDSDCVNVTSVSVTADQRRVPVSFAVSGASPHTLTITNTDGGLFRLDSVLVMPDDPLSINSAPAPSVEYLTLESGRVVAIDFSVSGGDIAQIIFLAFLSAVTVYQVVIGRVKND